ncbi:MAG: di-trans,poly-cis-decaprenylcistransferase [Rhodospirillaceae bacterium]|nr:di-trans,poly-cis-decaprenylcistransferase [Rhodospirillaceae bacterium]
MQSSGTSRLHVGIIMDGNGRWAAARGLPRYAGHRAGAGAVRRAIEAAPGLGIATLTLFAFSSDNWRRPRDEVRALFGLLRRYLRSEVAQLAETGVRLSIIGRRDRLPDGLAAEIARAEGLTAGGRRLHVRVALDYSARDQILRAVAAAPRDAALTAETLSRLLDGGGPGADVDLLIRTSGEQRLSDFLLWECAYAELHFTPRLWPDFGQADLALAMQDFHGRQRRFGGLSPAGTAGDAATPARAAAG